jgi:troponin T
MAAQKEKGGSNGSAPALDARKEMSKSKEQVEEEMKISLSIRIKPLQLESMDSAELCNKANQIWNTILALETDKYDYEQRHMNQDYEFKELNERQKMQLRNKAVMKGLDPESFKGAHPPNICIFFKYELRSDTRTYGERKKLYEGRCEVIRSELLWKEKFNEWS